MTNRKTQVRRWEREGAVAARSGQSDTACPYPRHSTERLYWMQGYDFERGH